MAEQESDKKYFDVAPPSKKTVPELKPSGRKIIPLEDNKPNELPDESVVNREAETVQPDTLMEPDEHDEKEEQQGESHAGFTITPLPEKNDSATAKNESSTEELDVVENKDDKADKTSEVSTENSSDSATEKTEVDLGAKAIESTTEEAKAGPKPKDKPELPKETEAEPVADTGPEDSSKGSGGSDNQESADKNVPVSEEQFASANVSEDATKKAANTAKPEVQDPSIYDTKEYYVPIGKIHHKHGSSKGAFVFGIICAVVVIAAALYMAYRLTQQ